MVNVVRLRGFIRETTDLCQQSPGEVSEEIRASGSIASDLWSSAILTPTSWC
jgi:hypothetical protein